MATIVTSRPNHYATLGLSPTAGSDEIARAFAREVSIARPRAFGGIAEVGIAYATLRDPAKRRAYDEALGLSAPAAPPAPAVEQRAEPFIAAAPREPVKPAASDAPAPGFRFEPSNVPERPAVRPRTFTPPQDRTTAVDEGRAVDWKRPAAAAAALIVAAGLFGAWQGSRAGSDAETEQPKPAVTVALPRATLAAEAIAPPAPPVAAAAEAPTVRRTRTFSARPIERTAASPPAAEPATPDPPAQAVADSSEQAAAETAPAPAAAAVASTMPLPNAVIARTIGSIGYACGRVTSTTATEAPGVFTVTCASGQSYRAAPVHGRYRFRRLGNH